MITADSRRMTDVVDCLVILSWNTSTDRPAYICRTHWRLVDTDAMPTTQGTNHRGCALEAKKRHRTITKKKALDLTRLPTPPVVARLEDAASDWTWTRADDDDTLLDEAILLFMTSTIDDDGDDACNTSQRACEISS